MHYFYIAHIKLKFVNKIYCCISYASYANSNYYLRFEHSRKVKNVIDVTVWSVKHDFLEVTFNTL